MATRFRQHRESLLFRMPWHLEAPPPARSPMVPFRPTACGEYIRPEDRGIDELEDPPQDDRCAYCQGEYMAGRAG